YQGGGSPPRCNRWRSPGPGPRSMPAAASAASGAAAWGYRPRPSGGGGGRSRWDSRSAFPRVSPALYGCGLAFSLVGRRPASGRGLDVYADQTLADALRGVAGRVAYAPGVTLNGWDEPPTRAGSPVPGGTPPARSYGSPRCRDTGTRSTVAVWVTSTPLPPGRTDGHLVGHPGGARRGRGRAGRTAPHRTPPDRVGGRTLFGAPCGGRAPGRRRRGHRGGGGPHRRRRRLRLRRRAASGHGAGLPAVGQPRGGDRAARRRGGRALPGGRCPPDGGRGAVAGPASGAGRLVAAGGERP